MTAFDTDYSLPCNWPTVRFRLEVDRLLTLGEIAQAQALIAARTAGTPWKEGQS